MLFSKKVSYFVIQHKCVMGMKFLFVIQGEGRGHFMQAIEMRGMLQRHGHEIIACLVGKSPTRHIPSYVYKRMQGIPIETFDSPNFVAQDDGKRPSVFFSFIYNMMQLPEYSQTVFFLRNKVKEYKPDAIINFYDVMLGIANITHPLQVPIICIGHQYLFLHKDFDFPNKSKVELDSLRVFTRATSIGACKRLALSFYPMHNDKKNGIIVVPPILREVVRQTQSSKGNYIHGYMLNSGFANEVSAWHKEHPDVEMHFFWDKPDAPECLEIEPLLTMHRIDDEKFLQSMAGCSGYATTAGFESVCEAIYLQKPIIMVPVHIEQECNGFDAMKVGAGIVSNSFDMDKLLEIINDYKPNTQFATWCNEAEERILSEIEESIKTYRKKWYHRIFARRLFK